MLTDYYAAKITKVKYYKIMEYGKSLNTQDKHIPFINVYNAVYDTKQ